MPLRFTDLGQSRLEGTKFVPLGQLLSKEMEVLREPMVSPWGIYIQWAREVGGSSWVQIVLLE